MDKRFQGKSCPFCKTPFKDGDTIVTCSICDMPHHLSCWQENNGCTTFGCTGVIKETIGSVVPDSVQVSPSITGQSMRDTAEQKTKQQTRRFETLFESEPNTTQGKVPVLIEKLTLIIDHENESLVARCIFRSLTDKTIMALLVDVICTDVWGKNVQSVEGFQFLDLKTKRDSTFGQTKPIPIPDLATRVIEVVIRKVLYNDRTMVDASGDTAILPKQEPLEAFFASAELAKEYARESNDRAKYTPVEGDCYWRCACGAINEKEDSICYQCHAEKTQLFGLLNAKLISDNLEAFKEEKRLKAEREQAERDEQLRQAEERMRLAQEEKERQEREEAERKAEEMRLKKEKRRKVIKKTCLISAVLLLVAFLTYAVGWHVIPYVKYTNACKALETQSYDDAYATFTALGGFRDSEEKAKESLYQKAIELRDAGSYLEAANEFEKIAEYKDSKEQGQYCQNEAAYIAANALFDEGKYKDAYDAFIALGNYSDSTNRASDSNYLYAKELFDKSDYAAAYEIFKALGKYQDSTELANESKYLQAIDYFDTAKYEEAVTAFKIVSNYKDVSDRLPEAKYQYALILENEKDWKNAYSLFKELKDYKDSSDKYKSTYYQYGLSLLSNKSFKDAVTVFSSLDNYQESKTKLNEAKYGYVTGHKSRTDNTTYTYLKDLKSAGYKDSKDIYSNLYAWTVTAVLNNSETDTKTNRSSISKWDTVYCHLKLSGGPPNEGIILKATASWPNGASNTHKFDGKWYDGSSGSYYCWYNDPAYGSPGTLRIRIYNNDTGELLNEFTVTLTS